MLLHLTLIDLSVVDREYRSFAWMVYLQINLLLIKILKSLNLMTCRFMKFEKEGKSRIGVMPRYVNADSVKWFEVEPHCSLRLINCFDDGNEVSVTLQIAL